MHFSRHGTTYGDSSIRSRSNSCGLTVLRRLLIPLAICTPCFAEPVWFDETNRATGYATFQDLATGYDAFVSGSSDLITFSDLADGTVLSNQYSASQGVTFQNTTSGTNGDRSGVRAEGGAFIKDLTGYDGSRMPDGDLVFRKSDNDVSATPFTILFNEPVVFVGAFVGMGTQGSDHSLSLSVYDLNNNLLSTRTVESRLWEVDGGRQNYEGFFAVRADAPVISRVEILNNSTRNSANALVFDDLTFGSQIIPEPVTGVLLLAGAWLFFVRRHSMRRRPDAVLPSSTTVIRQAAAG
jgi:hypothetical protein